MAWRRTKDKPASGRMHASPDHNELVIYNELIADNEFVTNHDE